MAILYQEEQRLFTIHTIQSTYQMKVDRFGYLLHLYYGDRSEGSMEYLLTYADRGFSGNPYEAGEDRTYSLDALPQEKGPEGADQSREYQCKYAVGQPLFRQHLVLGNDEYLGRQHHLHDDQ